ECSTTFDLPFSKLSIAATTLSQPSRHNGSYSLICVNKCSTFGSTRSAARAVSRRRCSDSPDQNPVSLYSRERHRHSNTPKNRRPLPQRSASRDKPALARQSGQSSTTERHPYRSDCW